MEPSGPFTSIAMTAATRCAPERATSPPRNRESREPVRPGGCAKQSAPGLAVLRVLGLFCPRRFHCSCSAGVVASHPCDKKKSQGWGTGALWVGHPEPYIICENAVGG